MTHHMAAERASSRSPTNNDPPRTPTYTPTPLQHSADGGPKTGPTKYDYLRRLARFFNRMQAEPSLAAALYGQEGDVDVDVGAEADPPVEGGAKVRCGGCLWGLDWMGWRRLQVRSCM